MSCVVGYLRHYRRWNGKPGLTLGEQRALIREVARERKYGRSVGRHFLTEAPDGEAMGWPVLHKALRMTEDNLGKDHLLVIPTLDAVQFNLSFLELLIVGDHWPIYVRSCWRRPKKLGQGTNYRRRDHTLGWLLSEIDKADDFAEIVKRVRRRNGVLSSSIQAGLRQAATGGVSLGSRRRGSYRFTNDDKSKGGQTTARNRRLAAEQRYKQWVEPIRRWRANGNSIKQIVRKLAGQRALTEDGRKFGPTLVYRILKRTPVSDNGPVSPTPKRSLKV